MTPKEKAIELVEKMFSLSTSNAFPAKQCALIAANEAKEQLIQNLDNEVSSIHAIYWEKVKKEIHNL